MCINAPFVAVVLVLKITKNGNVESYAQKANKSIENIPYYKTEFKNTLESKLVEKINV